MLKNMDENWNFEELESMERVERYVELREV